LYENSLHVNSSCHLKSKLFTNETSHKMTYNQENDYLGEFHTSLMLENKIHV
jgi:hypothetical protein